MGSEILKNFGNFYNDIINEKMERLNNRVNALSLLTGKEVLVDIGDEKIRGTVMGIGKEGGLILKRREGNIKKILNGDVSLSF